MLLGAELLDDVGEQVLDGFGFGLAGHDEGVVLDGGVGLGAGKVQDGVVVPEEVDFVDSELLGADLLDEALDDLVAGSLHERWLTAFLLTTLTFLLWLPLPPVLTSPILFLSLAMLAAISSWLKSMAIIKYNIQF